MSSAYPIDIEAAKNMKLFKKFMESKNKSVVVSGPKIQNVAINMDQRSQSPPQMQLPPQNRYNQPSSNMRQFQQQDDDFVPQPPKPMNFTRQQQYKKVNQIGYSHSVQYPQYAKKQQTDKQYPQFGSQRKTQPFVKQKTSIKDDPQLNKKFEKLLDQYNQLKDKVSTQRKQNKKQMIKLQQQIDQLNKRIFQLRSKQDQLILQNKRLKQKSISQAKQKQQIEQLNRQLNFQVQQLKDMVDGQQNSSKKRQDETMHWKKINEDLKQKLKQYQLQIYKLKDLNNVIERQKVVAEKQASNKQLHVHQMREKINCLITQNGTLRDQMFHITGKLYHFQQQNQSLKADLRRNSDSFPMSYLQEQLQQVSRHSKSQYIQSEGNNLQKIKIQSIPEGEKKTERRRGQFARQRNLKRNQTQNNQQKPNIQQMQMQMQNVGQQRRGNTTQSNNKQVSQAVRKLQQLNEQLQKLKDMKAMNGTLRRQKINIQREILQLQEFLKSKQ